MESLRQQYHKLDKDINKSYETLIYKLKSASFYHSENEDITECPVITFVSRNGENLDGHILKIEKENGIYIARYDNEELKYFIELNDISSLYDKITIVELLEGE